MTRPASGSIPQSCRAAWYLRARITGDPPGLYQRIGPAMQALAALAAPADPDIALSSSTTGATTRLNCQQPPCRSPDQRRPDGPPDYGYALAICA